MKVKVIKANLDSYWYADNIGKVYDVEEVQLTNHNFEYKVIGSELSGTKFFDKNDVEVINEEKAMKRADLRTGMRVVTNNGKVAIVLKDIGTLALQGGFNYINDLDDQLIFDCDSDWTVDAVYQGYTTNSDVLNFQALGELVWKRSKQTPEQKQLQEVMDKISDLQKQAEILQGLVGKSSK